MAISILDTLPVTATADGGTYTALAGSDRCVLWSTAWRSTTTDATHSDLDTLGAVALAEVAEAATAAGGGAVGLVNAISRMMQSAIPSGAQTADATWSGAPTSGSGAMFTLAGVHQASTVVDSDVLIATNAGTSVVLPAVDVVAGGIVIASAMNGANDITGDAAFQTILNITGAQPRFWCGYKLIAADGTLGATVTFTSNNRRIGTIVSLRPAVVTTRIPGRRKTSFGLGFGF